MAPLDDLYGEGSTAAFLTAAEVGALPAPSVEQFANERGVRLNVSWGAAASMKIACNAESMIFLSLDPLPAKKLAQFQAFYAKLFEREGENGGIPGFFRDCGVEQMQIAACESVPEFAKQGAWGSDGHNGLSWRL